MKNMILEETMNRNDYIKENYKRYTIRFSYDNELDIIEHLKLKKSVKNYLKRLIEQDMKIEEALERERIINGFDFR